MSGRKIIFYILAALVVSTLTMIFIQYNSAKNLGMLISGNEKLVQEFKVENELRELEKDVISTENKVRGTVATGDTSHIEGLKLQIDEIQIDLNKLQQVSDDERTVELIDQLDTTVQQKLQFNNRILDTYRKDGKGAAEDLIITQTGKRLADTIIMIVQKIDSTRKMHLSDISASIATNGEKAQRFSFFLIGFVLVATAGWFWYIINLIQKLIQSEKKVKEGARIKESFMANMSHEIRSPLNAILGFTNLLQRQPLSNQSKEYVQTIQRSGENLLTIINDVLDLSKIEAGMMRIESTAFSLRGLVHSVESMFIDRAREKNLLLVTTAESDIPDMLEGDATRLTQVLVNLVGNALKFTSQGTIAVTVTNEGRDNDKIQIATTVKDTGIGIEPAKLKKIFERFQQADDSITRQFGGTGLGLSIVRDLVLLQGGTINVESSPGVGTTFKFVIPYKIATGDTRKPEDTWKPIILSPDFELVKILVVEDNEINQSLINHLFAEWRLDYDVASNGKEAIELLRANKYHLILMDIQMPGMDGYTASQQIRQDLKIDTPIVAMTAHALAGEREKCFRYGMNDYISKPIKEEQLHSLISQFTKHQIATLKTKSPRANEAGSTYKYINLSYMKEVSGGNLEYEKVVTEQFTEMIPEDLDTLRIAWENKKWEKVRQLAHDMKTTISVMGLNEMLQPCLDKLEYEDLSEDGFQQTFSAIQKICTAAIAEARRFYLTIS